MGVLKIQTDLLKRGTMFSKRTDKSSYSDNGSHALPALTDGRKALKPASMISDDMVFVGDIIGSGELHLDGTVRGEIKVERLTIGETGHVEGSVTADTVEVRGRLVGTIFGKAVRLHGTAHVDGDITHEQLSMEPGAFFQGRSVKFQRQAGTAFGESVPVSATDKDAS
jgi:cytoskeletal protein CcmA (bactofilin family)